MKDKMYIIIFLMAIFLVGYGIYELVTGLDAYNGGQGKVSLGIGIVMLGVLYYFKKNDKPGR